MWPFRPNNRSLHINYFTSSYHIELPGISLVALRILSLSGDKEINPGPKSYALNRCFSICHWNLNNILGHMFTKVSLQSAYISVHKFDIICPSKIQSGEKSLEIPGCNLGREDHQCTSKRDGVCLYCKSSLPFIVIKVKYFPEYISFELRIGDKCCKFSFLYRSPSQAKVKNEFVQYNACLAITGIIRDTSA